MRFSINNLGAIENTEIDLSKKLTLFCGPNNTGKTYLSYIIYALITMPKFPLGMNIPNPIGKDQIEQLFNNESIEIEIDPQHVMQYKEYMTSTVTEHLDSIFGISEESKKLLFKDFAIRFSPTLEECTNKIAGIKFSAMLNINEFSFLVEKTQPLLVTISLKGSNSYLENPMASIINLLLYSGILNLFSIFPITEAAIFPVERMSIYTFKTELSINRNILIDQVQRLAAKGKIDPFEFIQQRSNRYPLAISKGLEVANDLVEIQKQNGEYYQLANEIEHQLLNGNILADENGDVQFISEKTSKSKKLPIHMTASIVKSLSSLIFHLKYLARKDSLIIIDEPEMNLHPDSQIILVHILGKLINAGLRLLVSTHSDYIIRELNNLIMAAEIKDVEYIKDAVGYPSDILINSHDVGAYFFKYRTKKKVSVSPLQVSEFGVSIASIDSVIKEQNEKADQLFFKLKYPEDE